MSAEDLYSPCHCAILTNNHESNNDSERAEM